MKNAVFWDVTPCGFMRTNVSEEHIDSIIRVTRIGKLGMLAVTSNRSTLLRLLVTANDVPSHLSPKTPCTIG
jgi:hypothetical protein